MIGSATTPYAEELKRRLRESCGAAVVEQRFLGPSELAAVRTGQLMMTSSTKYQTQTLIAADCLPAQLYAQSVLNIHPPLYDAYGMTIVEAASQGTP